MTNTRLASKQSKSAAGSAGAGAAGGVGRAVRMNDGESGGRDGGSGYGADDAPEMRRASSGSNGYPGGQVPLPSAYTSIDAPLDDHECVSTSGPFDDAGGFASPFGSQSIRQSLEVPRTRTSTHGGSDRDESEALGFNAHFGGVSRSESFGNESSSGLDLNAENYNLRIQLETVADERDSYAADLVRIEGENREAEAQIETLANALANSETEKEELRVLNEGLRASNAELSEQARKLSAALRQAAQGQASGKRRGSKSAVL